MKRFTGKIIGAALLTTTLTSAVYATHDNGQGKSQDGNHLDSVSVAPEPSTFWLFLAGTLMVTAYGYHRRKPR